MNVSVIETRERIVEVDVDTKEEAIETVRQMYKNGKIVLNENDHIETTFDTWEKEE